MIWDDTGFLLSKSRYNENSLISEIYTKKHGKVSGIIFGGLFFVLSYNLFPVFKNDFTTLIGSSAAVYSVLIFICSYFPNNKVNLILFNIELFSSLFLLSLLISSALLSSLISSFSLTSICLG